MKYIINPPFCFPLLEISLKNKITAKIICLSTAREKKRKKIPAGNLLNSRYLGNCKNTRELLNPRHFS